MAVEIRSRGCGCAILLIVSPVGYGSIYIYSRCHVARVSYTSLLGVLTLNALPPSLCLAVLRRADAAMVIYVRRFFSLGSPAVCDRICRLTALFRLDGLDR